MPDAIVQPMDFATKNARETIRRVSEVIAELAVDSDSMLVMADHHRSALSKFLEFFRKNMEATLDDRDLAADASLRSQIVSTRAMELELAVRFVQRCFLQPRRTRDEARILETVDWLCVEGFQCFVPNSDNTPLPIVAIESSITPAVWAPNAELPIPSIFRSIAIKQNVQLATLPVICLPGHLVRSPEFYPLLSHEVGHCIDDYQLISESLRGTLHIDLKTKKYWDAWLREIVADVIGLILSGQAFRIALEQFLYTLAPTVTISASHVYPPNALRLEFIQILTESLEKNQSLGKSELRRRSLVDQLGERAGQLVDDFQAVIAPALVEKTLEQCKDWLRNEEHIAKLATDLKVNQNQNEHDKELSFRHLASVITRLKIGSTVGSNFDALLWLNERKNSVERPTWVESEATWEFWEELLPTLRPTLLGADGKFKVPPLTLMATHDSIAFVGATNWQLIDGLKKAIKARSGKAWKELHIFFASRSLLKMVEYGPFDAEKQRDVSKDDLVDWLTKEQVASSWSIYEFDGPPVFASYWDWTGRGGRIHVSPALLDTRIGECPATDHLWMYDVPSDHYSKYLKHLDRLFVIARKLATSPELAT